MFAIPTYGFVAVVFADARRRAARTGAGTPPVAESATSASRPNTPPAGCSWSLLALRAFASGCTALTGVEAVSNGVPNFKPPKSRNAAATLAIMGGLTIAMFVGITALALMTQVHVADDTAPAGRGPAGYSSGR